VLTSPIKMTPVAIQQITPDCHLSSFHRSDVTLHKTITSTHSTLLVLTDIQTTCYL